MVDCRDHVDWWRSHDYSGEWWRPQRLVETSLGELAAETMQWRLVETQRVVKTGGD